jgi:DNA-binding XRE family transcriptional regulator
MDMRRLVGRNVKRLREKKGLTQEQFAEISGFSQQYISSLERGAAIQRSLPYTSYPWPLASITSI